MKNNKSKSVKISEYEKGDWTFHAKGAWVYEKDQDWPSMSVIGSSNYSHRSNRRDTEAQLYMVPSDKAEEFKFRLHDEASNLFQHSTQMEIKDLYDKEGK